MTEARKCTDCQLLLATRRAWDKMTATERAGMGRHEAHGLCNACYKRQRMGAGADPTREKISATEVLSEWEFLSHDWSASRTQRIRTAAPRLGMTPHALDKALSRAGVAA